MEQGQLLGLSGASGWVTGPQLHVALLKDGDYLDPLLFMQR
ncbi:MAG: M23 family metallopeptidase [Firmicutes bacterium]|nr:M23 family metallopeptidase [Bacillota bacterium]